MSSSPTPSFPAESRSSLVASSSPSPGAVNDDSSHSDGDHGGAAARLRGLVQGKQKNQNETCVKAVESRSRCPVDLSAGEKGESARDRVRRMLGLDKACGASGSHESEKRHEQGTTCVVPASTNQETDPVLRNSEDAEDDEIVGPHARRLKLRARQHRSATPETLRKTREASMEHSPGLFGSNRDDFSISPEKGGVSDSDDLARIGGERFKALVARKRSERLAREAEETRKKEAARVPAAELMNHDGSDGLTDGEDGRRLSQKGAARPLRKASQKALEEMQRETQRLIRSLQLAHQAKTRKKVTKATLFERFNFRPEGTNEPASSLVPVPEQKKNESNRSDATKTTNATSSSRPATPASAHRHTDFEMQEVGGTPSSSPPPLSKRSVSVTDFKHEEAVGAAPVDSGRVSEFPDLVVLAEAAVIRREEKEKDKATAADLESEDKARQQQEQRFRPKRHVRLQLKASQPKINIDLDSDDELEIEPAPRRNQAAVMFARMQALPEEIKAQSSRSEAMLRRLAQLDDPHKRAVGPGHKAKPGMSAAELQQSLLQRARDQARREREQRVAMLRAKGVYVPTAEEREREMAQVDDIVEQARREADDVMQRERELAKKESQRRRAAAGNDEPGSLAWDDSEDESYHESRHDEEEAATIELSGSEEEGDDEDEDEEGVALEKEDTLSEDEDGETMETASGALIDEMTDEDEGAAKEEEEEADDEDDDVDEPTPALKRFSRPPRKQIRIVSDDEDEDDEGARIEATPRPKRAYPESSPTPNIDSPHVPTSVLRSATKPFIPGLPVPLAAPAGLGLTQIFAGTMDDSQPRTAKATSPSQLMPTCDGLMPDSEFSQTMPDARVDMIVDTQPTQAGEPQGVKFDLVPSPVHDPETLLREDPLSTQMENPVEPPTQDAGYQKRSPLKRRFREAAASPESPVPVDIQRFGDEFDGQDSPHGRRAGKQIAGRPAKLCAEDEDEDSSDEQHISLDPSDDMDTDEFGFGTVSKSAFTRMREAAAKAELKRKQLDEFKKKSRAREMVEEQAEESEDEYAGLGGADGEDSDDDDAASVQEMIDDETKAEAGDDSDLAAFFADRDRALDEQQVEKLFRDITTGMLRRKRKNAGGNLDLSDSDDGGEARRRMKRRRFVKMQRALLADERISKVAENPRNRAFLRTIQDMADDGEDEDMNFLFALPPVPAQLQAVEGQSESQEAERDDKTVPDSQTSRLPAAQRRIQGGRRPANLAEIRASLSNLLDEPGRSSSFIAATELGYPDDDDDDDDDSQHDRENQHPHPRRTVAVVDRIAIKRSASSTLSAGRTAFATGTGPGPLSKVPALLRRATTTSSNAASSASASPTHHAGAAMSTVMAPPAAGRRGGLHALAKEGQRRAAMAENERKRETKKLRAAAERARAVAGVFGGGEWN